ncbi:MAG: polyphosphate kinase 1 [Bacteroidetes bacterium]|nr:polyphosphate kinase 1 [Bacteroidota bacterium]MDA1120572.1 polyphosphate kinase 1 [Bacteroidota bacterium]
MTVLKRYQASIDRSRLISRDLSWIEFNYRVLDQCSKNGRTLPERMKFLAITSSNADEFFMIRVGSLYNYIDYGKERIDYSGLRTEPFKARLFEEAHKFFDAQNNVFINELIPKFSKYHIQIPMVNELTEEEQALVKTYFKKTIFPMLTPMVYDSYHTFPILTTNMLVFGVVTKNPEDKRDKKKLSFIQIPQNLPRFYEINRKSTLLFVPIEEIIRSNIESFFRNVEVRSSTLFRVTRNGDFTLEESEDIDANILEEMKNKLKTRKTGRVVRIEIEEIYDRWMLKVLTKRWESENINLFPVPVSALIDYKGLWQIVKHKELKVSIPELPSPVRPLAMRENLDLDIFKLLKNRDILLHHPYNTIEPLLNLLEKAADDPNVLSIKITIYRIAENSRVVLALLKAAENGKHVSVLFEVKARFDEENNMREAQKLQKAGCFVIYGLGTLKTHTKLLLIVRKEGHKVTRYIHMSSGNYNEDTSRLYTDIGLISTDSVYANDVSEFFNVITGHSLPANYELLITAPREMRNSLIKLIQVELQNAKEGLPSGIVIKINSLQDDKVIEELYAASQAGVPIKLIIRGICCLRPGRKGLSENISVKSIVGEFLEHSRIFYFHNNGEPKVYSGSADIMVRSFDRRMESLFQVIDKLPKNQLINILRYNLLDNVNSYEMKEDGSYEVINSTDVPFNIHKEFYKVEVNELTGIKLF